MKKAMCVIVLCCILYACEKNSSTSNLLDNSLVLSDTVPLDYSMSDNWIPFDTAVSFDFDVIFIHPTTLFEVVPKNDDLQDGTVDLLSYKSLTRQASVFAQSCNIYAPYYRQMSIGCLGLGDDSLKPYFQLAYSDVEAAMNYYLDSLNNNRPYFIAGYSQGSLLLKEYLYKNQHKIDKDKLLAIYAMGYTFTADTIDSIGIDLSANPKQIPALITWNTISEGGVSPVIFDNATCVNPLSWDTIRTFVNSSYNNGARIKFGNDSIDYVVRWEDNFTGAGINDKGALVIKTLPDSILNQLDASMGPNVFHSYDYDFFYENLVENVAVRCNAYNTKLE
jgi:hypothetical protein